MSDASSRDLILLGSTGSIGTQALDVIARTSAPVRVLGLAAAGGNVGLLADQVVATGARWVAVSDPSRESELRDALSAKGAHPEVLVGRDAVVDLAGRPCDVVLNGMTGSVGLRPTLAALGSGATLALANKESLVAGGPLVIQAARAAGGTGLGATDRVVPVDSEHSALAQCLRGGSRAEVSRLVLTASGGPFRGRSRASLAGVTPEQALQHPTWSMGHVVTTNSATMVNKALEVLEAHLQFGIPLDRVDVVVHPQSVVHSMVEFVDGSTLAQASPPDMRLPIALGLGWPQRWPGAAAGCDWTTAATWEFFPLDEAAFPAVRLARAAGAAGGTFPAVFNAANEQCVTSFFEGRCGFLQIVDTVSRVVEEWAEQDASSITEDVLTVDDVLAAEAWARTRAAVVLRG